MLTELPPDIGTLSRLQQLDVEYNKLQQLPPDIGNLTRLDYLALNHNKLTFIPPQGSFAIIGLLYNFCLRSIFAAVH